MEWFCLCCFRIQLWEPIVWLHSPSSPVWIRGLSAENFTPNTSTVSLSNEPLAATTLCAQQEVNVSLAASEPPSPSFSPSLSCCSVRSFRIRFVSTTPELSSATSGQSLPGRNSSLKTWSSLTNQSRAEPKWAGLECFVGGQRENNSSISKLCDTSFPRAKEIAF